MSFLYLFGQLWRFTESVRWKIVLNTTLHLISFTGPLVQPYAFGKMIGSLERFGLTRLEPALLWLAVYFGGFGIFEIFHRSARHIQISAALHARERFTVEAYRNLVKLPLAWHTNHHSGDIVNRVNHAGQSLEDFGVVTENYLEQIAQTIGPIVVLAALSWDIALLTLLTSALVLAVALRINRMIHPILNRQKEALHAFVSRIHDYLENIKVIITLRRGYETEKEIESRYRRYSATVLRENRLNQPRCFILSFGAILVEILVFVYYLWKCRHLGTEADVGFLVMLFGYVRQISQGFWSLANGFYDLLHQRAAVESIRPIDTAAGSVASHKSYPHTSWNRIEIAGLSFGYPNRMDVLRNLRLRLEKGSRTAVIGFSGCGKTTLFRVLGGLYSAYMRRRTDSTRRFGSPNSDPYSTGYRMD